MQKWQNDSKLKKYFWFYIGKNMLDYYNDLAAIFFYYDSKIAQYLMAEYLGQQSRTMKNIARTNSWNNWRKKM